MNEPTISFTGNVAFDPTLRITPTGAHVLDLRVATTPRIRKGEDWEDSGTLWYDVVCWNKLADNVVDSVRRGDSVVVTGKLLNRVFERADKETGEMASVERLTVDATHLGLDLSRYAARVVRPAGAEAGVSDRAPSAAYGTAVTQEAQAA